MKDRVHESGISVTRNHPKDGFKVSWTMLFFILCQFLGHIWWFFKDSQHFQCSEKSSNMAKKWRKPMFNLHWTHFSTALPKPDTQISCTRYVTNEKKTCRSLKWFTTDLKNQFVPKIRWEIQFKTFLTLIPINPYIFIIFIFFFFRWIWSICGLEDLQPRP